jgi:hypothetical protein
VCGEVKPAGCFRVGSSKKAFGTWKKNYTVAKALPPAPNTSFYRVYGVPARHTRGKSQRRKSLLKTSHLAIRFRNSSRSFSGFSE